MFDAPSLMEDALANPIGPRGYAGGAPASALKTRSLRFVVVGTAPGGAVVSDQAAFFVAPELQPDVVIDATFALAASITTSVARYDIDAMGEYVARHPVTLRNINFTSADSPDTVSSAVIRPTRVDPWGGSALDQVEASDYQTAQDNQDDRVQVPIALKIDANTYVRITNDANATPARYVASFGIALGLDGRLMAPDAGPGVVKAPGQL